MTTTETITDRWGVSRPKTLADTMREKAAQVPKINVTTGKPLPIAEQPQSVQAAATVAGAPYRAPEPPAPTLGDSIVQVATEMRIDPLKLLDSDQFVTATRGMDPTDLEGIGAAISASGVKPAMRPNPAQGRSGTVPTASESPADKIRRATTHSTTGGAVANLL